MRDNGRVKLVLRSSAGTAKHKAEGEADNVSDKASELMGDVSFCPLIVG